jgi:hypothetical protein
LTAFFLAGVFFFLGAGLALTLVERFVVFVFFFVAMITSFVKRPRTNFIFEKFELRC